MTGFMTIRGKSRFIAAPRPELDAVQRRINLLLYPIDLSLGASPHGYVARRSTLTNARPHVGARFLQKFDVKDYFASITASRIATALTELGFGSEAATLISRLTSHRLRLPLGARTSPRISNILLIDFDDQMENLAREQGLRYTRYADDLAFSSQIAFDVSDRVEQAIRAAGFELNPMKTKQFKHGQPMFVTGLSIQDATRPRVRRRLKARLRQEFYYIEKFGIEDHAAAVGESWRGVLHRLTGQFHYCRTIEPQFTAQLTLDFPAASSSVAPVHEDSRVERAQRHRREFVAEVMRQLPTAIPFYVPQADLFEN
ncbi:reverse transcriptase family protein [Microbacterium radiodurans]|uniref:reverse transcriptase family protein n=1 Tax=Microbacterium radiodurans TaxID=661398 RepID=UPI00168B7626|nr:reverse transcriptase family protein [Microbacterium radiodurans]